MLGKISFHKHFKIINRVAYFVFICNNNSKSTKPYIITNAHIYERLSGCQDAFASLASVADDLGGGGAGFGMGEVWRRLWMVTCQLQVSTSLMQVDCQDYLSTNVIQVVSTTFTKFANI